MPSPDLAVCDDCLRELFTPGDPRCLNPFISCTHCGPRFSILRGIPYDRLTTSMDAFPMCPLCASQYKEPSDRRYHAQTVCCNACGPTLSYCDRDGCVPGERAVDAAVGALLRGEIVAVKGIGGYHLACSPFRDGAVSRLRTLKGREHKPFAVMFESLESLQEYCEVSESERELLESPAKPIVLLRRKESPVAEGVYAASGDLGAFLPYTPLQHLLLRKTGPLVMTSANVSSLPIVKDDAEMQTLFARSGAIGGMLTHDRAILRRLDDSVAMVSGGEARLIRRARGYVPEALPIAAGEPLLALGAQEKSAVCLAKDGYAYLSAEMGDLDSEEQIAVFQSTISDMQTLLAIKPSLAVCDLHPAYASTGAAKRLGIPVLQVQHHHAHIASVMAEHGLGGPVLGAAFDGTGDGGDGTVWGGEFLLVTPEGFTRIGNLKPVAMLGSDESVRQGWKSAACMRMDAGIDAPGDARQSLVRAALDHGINAVRSSSMGRAFDAVSAMLGICQESTYGGQGAVELENAAAKHLRLGGEDSGQLPFDLRDEGGRVVADLAPCFRAIHALHRGADDSGALALRFHRTVCRLTVEVLTVLSAQTGVRDIALGGGVFQNRILTLEIVPMLEREGFRVYLNRRVSTGDGGIALGQAQIGLWSKQNRG